MSRDQGSSVSTAHGGSPLDLERSAALSLAEIKRLARSKATLIRNDVHETAKAGAGAALAAGLLPPRNAIPRNLRDNMFRGGRRPLDIFRRIHQGIAGTPMPAGGPVAPGAQGTLTEQEMWQIVDYVRSLPFEPASQPQMRPLNSEAVVN